MTSRRNFLAGVAALSAAPSLAWSAVGDQVALAAAMATDGSFKLVGLSARGEITFQVPLPGRGHAAAAHPHLAEAVAIARRPGVFAKVIDCATGRVRQTLAAPKGRHFYGHATFSGDGALLFTTENDFASGQGRIGVWGRAEGYRRIGEFASGGIGPHEILTLPSGDLAVANGGIRTHPDRGRDKLNLDTMRANLSVFSTDGALRDCAQTPTTARHNSLRHIAAAPDGTVVCGFQWQGDPFDTPPLVSLYKGAGTLVPAAFDDMALRGVDGYIGSVCVISGSGFAASAPRGGKVLTFDDNGVQVSTHRADDICGLSCLAQANGLATDGLGNVYRLSLRALKRLKRHNMSFDNHLVALA